MEYIWKNHRKIVLLIIALILIIIGIIVFVSVNNDSNKDAANKVEESDVFYNKSVGVIEDKVIDNILFTDISCTIEDGRTKVSYIITNNRDEGITLNSYKLIFKDKNKEVIDTISGRILIPIEAGAKTNVDNYTTVDLSEAIYMEVELG